MELRSVTGRQFTTTGNTTICMRTRDGVDVASDFQIAPKNTGLQRSIISVGQVCDRGNIITFRSTGGTILNEFTGNRIEFERAGGVYRLIAGASARMQSGPGEVKQSVDGLRARRCGCRRSATRGTWNRSCNTE